MKHCVGTAIAFGAPVEPDVQTPNIIGKRNRRLWTTTVGADKINAQMCSVVSRICTTRSCQRCMRSRGSFWHECAAIITVKLNAVMFVRIVDDWASGSMQTNACLADRILRECKKTLQKKKKHIATIHKTHRDTIIAPRHICVLLLQNSCTNAEFCRFS